MTLPVHRQRPARRMQRPARTTLLTPNEAPHHGRSPGMKPAAYHLVFLPATAPGDATDGTILELLPEFPAATVHAVRFPEPTPRRKRDSVPKSNFRSV